MRRALLTAVLLAPSLALAQLTITETGDKPDEVINIAECEGATDATSTFAFQWTIATAFTQAEVRVSDTSGCPLSSDNSTAHTSSLGTFASSNNSVSRAATDIASRIGVPSAACSSGANVTVNVCVIPQNAAGTVISGSTVTGSFTLDRSRPPTPQIPSVTPGDSALRVSWTAVSGSGLTYRVEATPSGSPEGTPPIRSDEVTGTSLRLGGLEIGTQYDVVVIAISEGGNESAPSPAATGTPVQVDDFWRLYRNAGGAEEGGCSTTGGASLALLAFVPFALRRRRS